ncbi:MAG: YCF48-related protein [Pyrinomonadaceae bacterium]
MHTLAQCCFAVTSPKRNTSGSTINQHFAWQVAPASAMERARAAKICHQIARVTIQLVALWAMLVVGTAAAQTSGVWTAQAPLPVGESLHGVDMVSATEAWAVGESGIILRSADGGTSWSQQSSGTSAQLQAVRFLDSLHGWAVGNAVLYTTDGGQTWQTGTRSGNLSELYDVDFVDGSFGWACGGGVVMKTTDGGQTWSPQSVPVQSFQNLLSIDFVDRNRGWAVGADGIILVTTNGGANWTSLSSGTTAFLTGVSFLSTGEGWAVGGNVVLHTTNGGTSWTPQAVPANTWVKDILLLDGQNGWSVGQLQNIIHTTDGGSLWTTQTGGINSAPYNNYYLNGVRFSDSLHGIAVGDGGIIFNTGDGGQTWTPRQNGSSTITNRLTATDANHAWSANTRNEILYTTSGGQFWNRVNLPGGSGPDVTDVDFTDNLNGWASTSGGLATVWRTSDGGRTWQDAGAPRVSLTSIDTFDGRTIVAVGADTSNGAVIIRSTDSGATWTLRNFPQYGVIFRDVQMINASVGWVVGGASILKTTDGGATWFLQYQDLNDHLARISFADTLNGWATSVFGVLHSTNGGQTWTLQVPGLNSETGPDAIQAISPTVAWVCDFDGAVARTTNGGASWTRENVTTTTNFLSLYFLNADYGWIGGQRNTTGGPKTIASIYRRTSSAPTAAASTISGQVTTEDGAPLSGTTITLTKNGQTIRAITDERGLYRVEGLPTGEFYTLTPSRANYLFSPANMAFSLMANKTDAAFTAAATAQQANPLDDAEFFVRQQYVDFLEREPEQSGLDYWSAQLKSCPEDGTCANSARISVSAAFFIEQEFQQTGSYVYRLYEGGFGRRPKFAEFSADREQVVGGEKLEQNKTELANLFVQRAEFQQKYSSATTAESFVDFLLQTIAQESGVSLSAERETLVAKYNSGANINESRGLVLREAIESDAFKQAEHNGAFVLMQYFGYLKRDPDQGGYDFWLTVLNNKEPNNYRGMVCSFITSAEYQKRFSSVITHSNSECGQ